MRVDHSNLELGGAGEDCLDVGRRELQTAGVDKLQDLTQGLRPDTGQEDLLLLVRPPLGLLVARAEHGLEVGAAAREHHPVDLRSRE